MRRWRKPRSNQSDLSGPSQPDRRETLLDRLYRRYYTELCKSINVAFGPGPPEPEEVVQTAFAKFAALKDPLEIRDPRSFLFIAARNLVLDHKRRSKLNDAYLAEQIAFDAELMLEEITPERVVLAKDYFARLTEAIATLPEKEQTVLAMSRLEGKSYRQISAATGWSPASISRAMSNGMDRLMQIMETDPQLLEGLPGTSRPQNESDTY